MKILVALDKFKDSLTAEEACQIVAKEAKLAYPKAEIVQAPLTDGGEGFSSILTDLLDGQTISVTCSDPLGRPMTADYGLIPAENIPNSLLHQFDLDPDRPIALIEMARASGLERLQPDERNPWKTSTFGTGELIAHAIKQNTQAIFLGLGGSATNDLGCGTLAALGTQFISDEEVKQPAPDTWDKIQSITFPSKLGLPKLYAICDVDNPLLGERGCSAVYGPQKGLAPIDLEKMEKAVSRMSELLCLSSGQERSLRQKEGAGAAGGIAYGLSHLFSTYYTPGFQFVSGLLNLDKKIEDATRIITGEGMFDQSSLEGKGPGTLVSTALSKGKEIDVFAGKIDLPDSAKTTDVSFHQISLAENSLAENLTFAKELLTKKAKEVFSS